MSESTLILNAGEIQRALTRIAHEIKERNETAKAITLIGVQRGGVVLAQRLAKHLQSILDQAVPVGELDISMHRDDLDHQVPRVHRTAIPFDLNDKTVVLVDDVLFSGRTVRAALDALTDFGRPKRVQLAVLIDRGHRELPIKADYVGKNIPTSVKEKVLVRLKEADGEDSVTLERL